MGYQRMPKVHIAFERTYEHIIQKIARQLSGPYVHTEIIITKDEGKFKVQASYSTYINAPFSKTRSGSFSFGDDKHDFLCIDVTDDECDTIWRTCEVCALTKVPYNYKDMVLSIMPFRSPTDHTLFDSKTLFCSQAVVLIMRACLKADHVLAQVFNDVNSRIVTPTKLFEIMQPHCAQVTCCEVVKKY